MKNKFNELIEGYKNFIIKFSQIIPLNQNQQKFIIYTLVKDVINDDFFREYSKIKNIPKSPENLISYLSEKYMLNEKEIKEIVLSSPQILLYSDRVEDIYNFYKFDEHKAIILVNGDQYKCYRKEDSFVEYIDLINEDYKLTIIEALYNRIKDDPYYIDELINGIKREDIAEYYKINENFTLKEKLEKLNFKTDLKNYYIESIEQEKNNTRKNR